MLTATLSAIAVELAVLALLAARLVTVTVAVGAAAAAHRVMVGKVAAAPRLCRAVAPCCLVFVVAVVRDMQARMAVRILPSLPMAGRALAQQMGVMGGTI